MWTFLPIVSATALIFSREMRGIVPYAKVNVNAVGCDPHPLQQDPQGKRVLSARYGDDGTVAGPDKAIPPDGRLYSFFEKDEEMGIAECCLMRP